MSNNLNEIWFEQKDECLENRNHICSVRDIRKEAALVNEEKYTLFSPGASDPPCRRVGTCCNRVVGVL
jgi:hypothetical protein